MQRARGMYEGGLKATDISSLYDLSFVIAFEGSSY